MRAWVTKDMHDQREVFLYQPMLVGNGFWVPGHDVPDCDRPLRDDELPSIQPSPGACVEVQLVATTELDDYCASGRGFVGRCDTLDEVDLSTDVERGQGVLWGNECEGMCGV